MKQRGGIWVAVLVLLFAGLTGTRVAAQSTKAAVSGKVVDSSGGVVAGAMITVKNVGTGIARTITCDDQGRFNVLDIDIGAYEIDAEASGFKKYIHTGVVLTVGQQLEEDITLQVGASAQAVTVEGTSTQVETGSASVGVLVEPTQMQDIPLNGRNYTDLLTLAPGVVTTNFSKSSLGGNGSSYSVSGGRAADQAFLLDNTNGTDYNGHGVGGSAVSGESMGVEAIAEFQMLTNTYSAQYGGFGAAMAAVTKSGTNSFHGTGYEYFRNDVLDSRNLYDPVQIPKFRRNQFGASVGGPIKKDKLFFFSNYEGLRSYWGLSSTVMVPDASSRGDANGNGAMLPDCVINTSSCTKGKLDPLPAATGLSAGNNAVGQVAPAILATLHVYPLPGNAAEILKAGDNTGIASYIDVGAQVIHENYWISRVDYNLSEKDSFFARYMLDESNLLQPSAPDLWPIYATNGSHMFTIEWKHIPNQNWVNLARFSFVRAYQNNAFLNQLAYPQMLWYPVTPNQPQDGALTVTGLTGLGPATSGPKWFAPNHFVYADDVLWSHGNHTIKFGMSFERIQENVSSPFNEDGSYQFGSLTAFLQATVNQFTGVGVGQANALRYARELLYTPYVQDDWKVSSKLTLNLGLRYDGAVNPTEAHGNFYNLLDPPNGAGISSYVQVPHAFAVNPARHNFDPRIGLAYSPFADHKTSIRAGFGIFHDIISSNKFLTSYALQPPYFNLSASATNFAHGTMQIPYFSCANPACPNSPVTSIVANAAAGVNSTTHLADYPDGVTPYMMQYNLNIQRELPGNTILTVGYVGSRTVHLFTAYDVNPPTLTPTGPGGALAEAQLIGGKITSNPRINPNFAFLAPYVPDGWSRYDSLQVSANRRLTKGLQAQVSYTWSRCFDLTDMSTGLEGTNSGVGAEDVYPYDIGKNWGPCDVDRRNSLVTNAVYNLPFHGNRLVEGWQVSGLWTWTSGTPFSVDNGYDNVGSGIQTGIYNDRVNWGTASALCSDPTHPIVKQGSQWYNPNCFAFAPVGIQGNLGKNVLTGPQLFKVDFALTKMTKVTERLTMQFRAEAFNILNDTNKQLVTSNLNNFSAGTNGTGNVVATSGTMNNTATIARQIQFGVKIIY